MRDWIAWQMRRAHKWMADWHLARVVAWGKWRDRQ
jgi:hypothetical protein